MTCLWITSAENGLPPSAELDAGLFEIAGSGAEGLNLMRGKIFDTVVINSPLPGWSAGDLLLELLRIRAGVPVLVRNECADLGEAVRLTKMGAFHFLDASTPPCELGALLEAAYDYSRAGRSHTGSAAGTESWSSSLIGRSPAMQSLAENIRLLGPRRCTVLITGETGTGKELVARALHQAGSRARFPMVAVNCSALPENLLEAELFGHVRGAFTGAVTQRLGRFEQANRSTLFLDEIADMPLDVQSKLLRVLQEREFQRLGSSETIRVDVRVIAACNADLAERVADERFREDLYYRLNVIPIEIPPLRDRLADVPLLVRHFIRKVAAAETIPEKHVTGETLAHLMHYHWPGNIRQLENSVEVAMILSGDRSVLYPADFRLPVQPLARTRGTDMLHAIDVPDHGLDFEGTVGRIERGILQQALLKTKGNKKQAAEMLGLKRTTLSAKLKSLEVSVA